jgi:hypothetical protein
MVLDKHERNLAELLAPRQLRLCVPIPEDKDRM